MTGARSYARSSRERMTSDLDHSAARQGARAPATAPRGASAATAPDVGAPEPSAPVARPLTSAPVDIGAPAGGRRSRSCAPTAPESTWARAAPVAHAARWRALAPFVDVGAPRYLAPVGARSAPRGRPAVAEYQRALKWLAARRGAGSSAGADVDSIGDRPDPNRRSPEPTFVSLATHTNTCSHEHAFSEQTFARTPVRLAAAEAHLVLGLLGLCLGLLRIA